MLPTSIHYFSFIFTVLTKLDVQWAQCDYVSSDDSEKLIAPELLARGNLK